MSTLGEVDWRPACARHPSTWAESREESPGRISVGLQTVGHPIPVYSAATLRGRTGGISADLC